MNDLNFSQPLEHRRHSSNIVGVLVTHREERWRGLTSVICVLGEERCNLEKDDLTRFRLMLDKAAEMNFR